MTDGIGRNIGVAGFCGRGLKRKSNEDAISIDGGRIAEEVPSIATLRAGPHVFLIGDGMGGHASGRLASDITLKFLGQEWSDNVQGFDVLDALRRCNRHVFEFAQGDLSYRGMGSTIAGLILKNDNATWFNVGDSRVYLWRNGALKLLSKDHVAGLTTSQKRHSHAITQSIGGSFVASEVWPAIGNVYVLPKDQFFLCSDGVTDAISDDEISQSLAVSGDLGCQLDAVLERVMSAGAPDNISALILRCGLPESSTRD